MKLNKLRAAVSLFLAFIGTTAALPAGQAQREYQAQWIWCNVEHPKPFHFVRFRKMIELPAPPVMVTAYITADTFYRLWINGQLAMHGPARSSHGKATVDPVSVGHLLNRGKNTLMIEAFHGICPIEALAQAPGLLCELEAESGGKKQIIAATDATWESSEIAAWSRQSLRFSYQRGWMEDYDSRRELGEKVRPTVVLGKVGMRPWQTVTMRDIPLPAPLLPVPPVAVMAVQRADGFVGNFKPGRPNRGQPEWDRRSEWFRRLQTENLRNDDAAAVNPGGVTSKGDGDALLQGDGSSISYDFGRGYVGFIGFEVSGHDGQVLEIAWGETGIRPRAQVGNNAIRYTLREGRQRFLAFNPQFVRFLRIVQRGQGDLKLHRLWLTEFHFVAESKGSFRCSDDQLNSVYDAARRTAMLCTLDAFMDCPHRERCSCPSVEGYWTQKAVFSMFGDTSVSRRSIIYGADSVDDAERVGPPGIVQIVYPIHLSSYPVIIPTSPLFWVLHAGLYERCSGDTEFIQTMIPVMRRNLAALDSFRNSEGLLSFSGYPFWIFLGYEKVRGDGISVACNAIYAKVLDEAARLERLAGDTAHADDFGTLAHQVRSSLNRYCSGDTFYPDTLLRDQQKNLIPSPEASETTQHWVMWAGVPPQDRERRMWQVLRKQLLRTGPYSIGPRLEVAAKLGDHATLLRDIKAMFVPMVKSAPGTLWESRSGRIARCHIIGCGVGGILTEEVLGIRFGFPLRITPHNGGMLHSCNGYITTPRGRVEVAWDWQKDRYQLRASIPKGITAEVVLPQEAKAVWQLAPARIPWRETITIAADAVIVVEPGKLAVKKDVSVTPGAQPQSVCPGEVQGLPSDCPENFSQPRGTPSSGIICDVADSEAPRPKVGAS